MRKAITRTHPCQESFTCKVLRPSGDPRRRRQRPPQPLPQLPAPASTWTSSPATGHPTAAALWSLWRVWVRKGGEWAIIHRCRRCGALSSNRVAADDNPMKLMSIAMKPLGSPPFPLEYLQEMTDRMGGQGDLSLWEAKGRKGDG